MEICECGKLFKPAVRGNGRIMCKSCVSNRRKLEVKRKSIEYLGGKCIDCGYSKCIEALEFDHINPENKEFGISGRHCLSWENLKKELDKCELRCANCHRERHFYLKSPPLKYTIENHIIKTICKRCKKDFPHIRSDKRIYCSVECYRLDNKTIEWPDLEILSTMIINSNFVKVGKQLGISDNAIRKHLIKYGLNPKSLRSIKDNKFVKKRG